MKRLLLIGLTTILSFGSLATSASADPDWSRHSISHHHTPTSQLSPIPEPLRYRVERRPETVEHNVQRYRKWPRADRYSQKENYRRERRRHIRIHDYYHGTRNDPGRY